ncbi:MAG: tRNA dihydrouridine synthase DusB [Myxococcales bacterium]|nr:tRNA dihydrouridine synthase DusB [Myxococcales bacterium]
MANAPELDPDVKSPVALGSGPHSAPGFDIGGQVRVAHPFVLAPMSGVTDTAFRRMVQSASGGTVGLLVTEFISIEGLTRTNLKAMMRMAFNPIAERPLSVQIFGADADRMASAARIIEAAGAQIVDINCGCPAPKVVRKGGGAELMRQSDHLAHLVESTVAATKLPVTVKIRSGWSADTVNAVDVARKVEAAGAAMVAVHGRTRLQLYTGEADWSVVQAVAAAVRIPVLGSGDVATAEEALWRLQTCGAAGVMIGRAAIMNPWIFGQIDDLVAGRPARAITNQHRLEALRHFRDMMAERMPDRVIPGRLKQFLARMTKGFAHGTVLRERAMRAQTTAEMFEWIEGFFDAVDHDRLDAWVETARSRVPSAAAL